MYQKTPSFLPPPPRLPNRPPFQPPPPPPPPLGGFFCKVSVGFFLGKNCAFFLVSFGIFFCKAWVFLVECVFGFLVSGGGGSVKFPGMSCICSCPRRYGLCSHFESHPLWEPPKCQGSYSHCPHVAPQDCRGCVATLISSPHRGTPKRQGLCRHFAHIWALSL